MSQRYINKVLWFGTKTGGEYGFIQYEDHTKDGIFFHKNQILKESKHKLNKFCEDAIVTFNVRKSPKDEEKLEAYDIILLEDSLEIDFLIEVFFSYINSDRIKGTVFFYLKFKMHEIISEENKEVFKTNIEKSLENEKNLDSQTIDILLNLSSKVYDSNDDFILEKILDLRISYLEKNNQLEKLIPTIEDISKIYENSNNTYNKIISYLNKNNNQNPVHYHLWIKNLTSNIPNQYIIDNFYYLNKKYKDGFLNNIENNFHEEVLKYLIVAFETRSLKFNNDLESYNFIKTLIKNNLFYFIPYFLEFITVSAKFELWLNDEIDYFNFEEYVVYLTKTEPDKQQLAFKKIFNIAHRGLYSLKIEQLDFIKVTDFSTKVVIELIQQINKSEKINKYTLKGDVLRLVADLVTDSKDLLSLNGYFDSCTGRTREYYKEVAVPNASEPKIEYYQVQEDIEYVSSQKQEPIFCEGRLSISKDGAINLSKVKNKFWWCRNLPCFAVCSTTHEVANWKNYSIIDFLEILGIQYDPNDIQLLYATINKVNRFLERLNCRSCKRILKPVSNSNYGFYRVSQFYCDNEVCHNSEKIYLSHCSNSRCYGLIDSRDVVQCSNHWYICETCFSCCATKNIEQRKENLSYNKQEANQTKPAHKGKCILCPTCANKLEYRDPHQQAIEYDKTLKDFERLAELVLPINQQKLIGKSGKNKYGNKWFVIYQAHLPKDDFINYLHYWQSLGFNIPDFPENIDKLNYLVSEPIKKKTVKTVTHFQCNNCNLNLDLGKEFERVNAINYWHFPSKTQDST